jgi:hypothetical protein
LPVLQVLRFWEKPPGIVQPSFIFPGEHSLLSSCEVCMNSSCAYCNGAGYIEYTEQGRSLGFNWSATSRQKCLCQVPKATLKDGRTVPGSQLKTRESTELPAWRCWLLRMKARWQLRGRLGVDANGNIWRGLRLFYRPLHTERRALREALNSVDE